MTKRTKKEIEFHEKGREYYEFSRWLMGRAKEQAGQSGINLNDVLRTIFQENKVQEIKPRFLLGTEVYSPLQLESLIRDFLKLPSLTASLLLSDRLYMLSVSSELGLPASLLPDFFKALQCERMLDLPLRLKSVEALSYSVFSMHNLEGGIEFCQCIGRHYTDIPMTYEDIVQLEREGFFKRDQVLGSKVTPNFPLIRKVTTRVNKIRPSLGKYITSQPITPKYPAE